MERETEENGITIQDLFRAARRWIFLVLLISLALGVVAALVFQFGINPKNSKYSLEFTLSYLGSGEGKYPDGSGFYIQDLVSQEYLERAQRTSDSFLGIDISKMCQKDDITVTFDSEENRYELQGKQSYFKTQSQATDFLRALANVPAEIAKERATFGGAILEPVVYENASFEDKISLLDSQRQSLLQAYDGWISALHENYTIGGKTLKAYRTEVETIFGEFLKGELKEELDTYGYVKPEQLAMRIAELKVERALNENELRELNDLLDRILSRQEPGGSGGEAVSAMIAQLMIRNLEIDDEISKLNEEDVMTFAARLDAEFGKLTTAGETLRSIAKQLYLQETRTIFYTSTASALGGTNPLFVGVGIFLIALIAGGMIAAYSELSRKNKSSASKKEEIDQNENSPEAEEKGKGSADTMAENSAKEDTKLSSEE